MFLSDFFSNLFSSKLPLIFFLETKCFASIKDCWRFSALCDLPETFIRKFFNISKMIFPQLSVFLKGFRLRKLGILLFPAGEEWFSRFMRIPSGIFWRSKIDEILTILSFYPWFSVWYCLFGLRSTAPPLCLNVVLTSVITQFQGNWIDVDHINCVNNKNSLFIVGWP